MANYYPRLATALSIEGQATIHCLVAADGTLAECSVVEETPKGLRFGEATLRLANLFRMKPMTVDGAPVSGGQINIPVRFQLPQATPPQPDAQATTAVPPPKTLALARRVAAAMAANFVSGWKKSLEQLRTSLNPLSTQETTALDVYLQSVTDHTSQLTDDYAAIYAKVYNDAELAAIAAFLESPAGKAWYSRERLPTKDFQAAMYRFQQTASADAKARLCQQTTCPASRAPASANSARPDLPLAK